MKNIAVIGCGAIARNRHIPAVAESEKANLYCVCDPVKENADEMAGLYHTKAVYDLSEVLKDPSVDAVIICTPERFHCANVVDALQAGKDVLVEKPLAMNPEEGKRILEAWKRSGKRLEVAFAQRLGRDYKKAKELLDEKVIGKPLVFRTTLAHRGAEYASVGEPTPDFYDKRLAGIGDVMLSVGCHRMDLMPYLFDSPIKSVMAMTPTIDKTYADGTKIKASDHAMVEVELQNGVYGSVWISWCDYGVGERGTVIYGTEGTMSVGEAPGVVIRKRSGEVIEIAVEKDPDAWKEITRHFIKVLNGEEAQICDGTDGQRCLLALEAVRNSNQLQKQVSIDYEE